METFTPMETSKAAICTYCNFAFAVNENAESPFICEKCKKKSYRTQRLELTEENRQLKKILRDIWNINSHGNMEYFGESVMEILNNANKSLWEEK